MILISYDISNDKLRTRFAKFLQRFGHRIQYSVFEIENSERILNNVEAEIKNRFYKEFEVTDSVYIFRLSPKCVVTRYGHAENDTKDIMVVN